MELQIDNTVKFNTPLHRVDPRVKIVSLIGFIVVASTLTSRFSLLAGIGMMLILAAVSRTPISFIGKRFLWLIPFGGILVLLFPFITAGAPLFKVKLGFLVLAASREGLDKAVVLFFRLVSAMLALSVLNATTGFGQLMDGFRHLRVPKMLVYLIEFTVRYFFVLKDELDRMRLARKSRGYDFRRSALHFDAVKTLSQMIAVLFLRSVDRGERVFHAMLARGYSGEAHCCGHCRMSRRDLCWGATLVVMVLVLKLTEVGGSTWQTLLK